MTENVIWHEQSTSREEREVLLNQKSFLLWFTGLSGSGKSTIAQALQNILIKKKKLVYILDGDNVRHGLNSDLEFSSEERKENIRRISEVAKLFVDAGIITVTCFISPFKKDRKKVKKLLGKDFIEVFVDCPLKECEKRDPKGLYKKARAGSILDFTGINSPYEAPEKPDIIIDTSRKSHEDCVSEIMSYLEKKGLILP